MFKLNDTVILEREFATALEPRFVYGVVKYIHPAYRWSSCDLGKYMQSAWNEHIYTPAEFKRRFPNAVAVHI